MRIPTYTRVLLLNLGGLKDDVNNLGVIDSHITSLFRFKLPSSYITKNKKHVTYNLQLISCQTYIVL